jgi:protoporphyrinogen/coproporphyrinogen III oxidase
MIAIVGGGITGLAAAYELTARGMPFQLFEASPRVGGLIRTDHVDGFTIEAGPDSILAQKPAAIELCESLGLGPKLISTTPPRTAFVVKHGHFYPLPSASVLGIPITWRGISEYELLSTAARARLALEPLIPPRRDAGDESVGAFFRRRFGGETVDLVAEPLLGGIHAGDVEALSMTSLFPRFVEAEASGGSVLRSLRNTRPPSAGDGLFRSLADGMGELVTALERRMPDGSIRCNAPVAAIVRDGTRWHVSAAGTTATARAVIIAAPARVASELIQPIDPRAGSLCGEVPYVSTVSVALAWPRSAVAHPLEGSGFVVARRHNDVRITACTWVSSKWSGRAPAGAVLLRVFAGGAHDPGVVDLPDEEIVDIARRDLSGLLGTSGAPLVTRVYRWRDAGAQHNVGQIARVSEIEKRLAGHPGLFVAGSGFRSVGIPDCVADGRAAAAAACTNIGD